MYTSIKSISAKLDLTCMQENESKNMDNDNNRNLLCTLQNFCHFGEPQKLNLALTPCNSIYYQ